MRKGAAEDFLDTLGADDLLCERSLGELSSKLAARVDEAQDLVRRFVTEAARRPTVLQASLEVSTHVKWLLHGGFGAEPSIWCHQFKPTAGTKTYARSIHDHRYDFVTIALSGGYTQRIYSDVESDSRLIEINERRHLTTSSSSWMYVEEAHQLVDIADRTITLVVQGRPRRSTSYSYNLTGKRVGDHPDLLVRLADFAEMFEAIS